MINNLERLQSKSRRSLIKGFKARKIHDNPYIVKIKNFVSDEEIDELMRLAKGKFERSNIVLNGQLRYDDMRTSSTAYLMQDGLPDNYGILENLIERVQYLTNCKREEIEGMMAVRYKYGEKFDAHVDYFGKDEIGKLDNGGQRIGTFFIYLNSLSSDEGGETEFTKLGIKSKPRKGDAIFFWDRDPKTKEMLPLTEHRGNPVTKKGTIKYGANLWVRSSAFY